MLGIDRNLRLIGAHNRRLGCRATATFDQNAVKLAAFVAL
jgi:hypothetical protein